MSVKSLVWESSRLVIVAIRDCKRDVSSTPVRFLDLDISSGSRTRIIVVFGGDVEDPWLARGRLSTIITGELIKCSFPKVWGMALSFSSSHW